MKFVLVVSRDRSTAQVLQACFKGDASVVQLEDRKACIDWLLTKSCEFIFIDIQDLGDPSSNNGYKPALQEFWRVYPSAEVVVMTPQDLIRNAVAAVKAGASEYLSLPLKQEEVKYIVQGIRQYKIVQSELDYLRDQFWDLDDMEVIQTRSPSMRDVFEKVRAVAQTKSTVLLTGETGVGKGVLATLIHRHSDRRNAQFISVHCGAIPDTLLESELFGHEKGAFTGAVRRKLGKFEIANGGTIFLDEMATITPSAQIKLLQILQDGTFQRVGGEETISVNVRVIAATNADLKEMAGKGEFIAFLINIFRLETSL